MTWLAFTGTQHGMAIAQRLTVERIVRELCPTEVAHGDCVGADRDFDEICCKLAAEHTDSEGNYWRVKGLGLVQKIVLHPASDVDPKKRALCHQRFPRPRTIVRAPRPALERNGLIVDGCSELIATPDGFAERLRSGTWYTVRKARRASAPVRIVWPNGTVTREPPGPRYPVHTSPTLPVL